MRSPQKKWRGTSCVIWIPCTIVSLLFGDKPFLQVPELAGKGKPTKFGAYQINMSENQVIISQWNQAQEISTPDLIRLLLRSSCYSCGGKGKRFQNKIVLTEGYRGKINGDGNVASGTYGTLLGKNGYLHSYLLGETLLDTLRLNLLTEEEIVGIGAFPTGLGTPFWEKMPHGEDCPRAQKYLRTYHGELFPLDKFSLVEGDGLIMTDGIKYPDNKKITSILIDPALIVTQNEKTITAVLASTSERPWRELPSLLSFLEVKDGKRQPYFLSMGLWKLRKCCAETVHIWTGGMQVSSKAGEQRLSGYDDYVESEFRIPVQSATESGFTTYKSMMKTLNSFSNILNSSIIHYFKTKQEKEEKKPKMSSFVKAIAERSVSVFWERMEPSAQQIINTAFCGSTEEQREAEYKKWAAVAREVYNQFCPRETARQLTAWVESEPNFFSKKTKSPQKKG
ncbi:MAG: CRISPR-associated protein Cse1 (CRISPR_cse1) [Lentisphaerae bacterium ADurb.Bin242]|nr:MAG: CRISPR-associated protein Cse1 (CRISPR_cse1) [Lentisphaerae bacterium ADurb.Bin242]